MTVRVNGHLRYGTGRLANRCGIITWCRNHWDELVDKMGPRPGMWVGDRYALVRSFVGGFGAARNDDVLDGFQRWLSSQSLRDLQLGLAQAIAA